MKCSVVLLILATFLPAALPALPVPAFLAAAQIRSFHGRKAPHNGKAPHYKVKRHRGLKRHRS